VSFTPYGDLGVTKRNPRSFPVSCAAWLDAEGVAEPVEGEFAVTRCERFEPDACRRGPISASVRATG
jgi:hypothetical protein